MMPAQTPSFQGRRLLPRSWSLFFQRFGKFTPIQEKAIPVILQGKNTCIISATASGKTEAVLAPIIELILRKRGPGIQILYITPTRALVNDIYERIFDLLGQVEIDVQKKTSDSPIISWKNPPDLLITTPESLDSIICRHPEVITHLRFLILDEIHILDGMYRGDQLIFLIRRLKELSPIFNIHLLSATIHKPEDIVQRYCGDGELMISEGSRSIEETLVPSIYEAFQLCKNIGYKKILIFCNKRQRAELLAGEAKKVWDPNHVVVHHGSLHKNEREESESVMKHETCGICIATTTLEIGVDIGSIDVVVLADVPWTVSSLIQRIGRAGRRTGITKVIGVFIDENEKEILKEMIQAARENLLEEKKYFPDPSVSVQQLFSVLYAHKEGVLTSYFVDLCEGILDENDLINSVLPYLKEKEFIEISQSRIFGKEKIYNMGDHGFIHSNIPDTDEFDVKNESSERFVGNIELPATTDQNSSFILAGKVWKVVKVEKKTIFVQPMEGDAIPASFRMANQFGSFFMYLPPEIKEREIKRLSG